MIQKKVEINGQVYTIRKPTGRVGALHFSLIAKCAPKDAMKAKNLEDFTKEQLAESVDYDKIIDTFAVWSEKVLPHLIVDGPFKYEDMPGEDQFGLFIASLEEMNIGKEFFRVIR